MKLSTNSAAVLTGLGLICLSSVFACDDHGNKAAGPLSAALNAEASPLPQSPVQRDQHGHLAGYMKPGAAVTVSTAQLDSALLVNQATTVTLNVTSTAPADNLSVSAEASDSLDILGSTAVNLGPMARGESRPRPD